MPVHLNTIIATIRQSGGHYHHVLVMEHQQKYLIRTGAIQRIEQFHPAASRLMQSLIAVLQVNRRCHAGMKDAIAKVFSHLSNPCTVPGSGHSCKIRDNLHSRVKLQIAMQAEDEFHI